MAAMKKKTLYEIGKLRPDGKRNVWAMLAPRGFEEWVIVGVVLNWQAGMMFIEERLQ